MKSVFKSVKASIPLLFSKEMYSLFFNLQILISLFKNQYKRLDLNKTFEGLRESAQWQVNPGSPQILNAQNTVKPSW